MKSKYDVVVIGGGPAGIFTAITVNKNNKKLKIAILESKDKICNKLRITGGGRCNFTNNRDISQFFDMVVNNPKFLYSSFYSFDNLDLMKTIKEDFNLDYVVETENNQKVYLKNGNTGELIENIADRLNKYNIDVYYGAKVIDIELKDVEKKVIHTTRGRIKCSNIAVSTGGVSYPKTGSDGSMFSILEKLGHNIVDLKPGLVPINLNDSWLKNIPGISIEDVEITVISSKNNKKLVKIIDDIVFTHKGIGGPVSLKTSSYINKNINDYKLIIDYCPSISKNGLREMIDNTTKKTLLTVLKKIFPNNFAKAIEKEISVRISNRIVSCNVDDLNGIEIESVISFIKSYELTQIGIGNIGTATITSGGVNIKEVDSSTMKSKLIDGMYFAGEVLDIDALTGGFNLQIAFSTAYLAGISIAELY